MASRAVVLARKQIKIESIEIDSCLDESHQLTNTVTDHPVEQGFNISDHVRPNPDQVTLRCFVSNTPLSVDQTKSAVRQGAVNFDTTAPQVIEGRGNQAFLQLKKLRDEGTLIEVVTTLKTYGVSKTEGLVIESLTIPRTRQNYDGLEFTIQLKQIRIVKNRQTRDTRPKDKRAEKKKKKGKKTTEEKPLESKLSAITGAGEVPIQGSGF